VDSNIRLAAAAAWNSAMNAKQQQKMGLSEMQIWADED
jgi:hypothetical protein